MNEKENLIKIKKILNKQKLTDEDINFLFQVINNLEINITEYISFSELVSLLFENQNDFLIIELIFDYISRSEFNIINDVETVETIEKLYTLRESNIYIRGLVDSILDYDNVLKYVRAKMDDKTYDANVYYSFCSFLAKYNLEFSKLKKNRQKLKKLI